MQGLEAPEGHRDRRRRQRLRPRPLGRRAPALLPHHAGRARLRPDLPEAPALGADRLLDPERGHRGHAGGGRQRGARRPTGSSPATATSGWRSITASRRVEMMHNMFGNAQDSAKGRQMPVHFSFAEPIQVRTRSPLLLERTSRRPSARPTPPRHRGEDTVALVELRRRRDVQPRASTPGMNFAGVWKAPVVFLCQNNGWAISCSSRGADRLGRLRGQGPGLRHAGRRRGRQRPASPCARRRCRRPWSARARATARR